MKRFFSLLVLMVATLTEAFSANLNYTYMKIAVDGMAVNNALYAIKSTSKNVKASIYYEKIDRLLDELAMHNSGFRKDMFPVELSINEENEAYVKKVCSNISTVLNEIRDFATTADAQFDLNDLPLVMTLKSENPGDYYLGINPDFKFTLANHPYRTSIEELQLQDIGFVEVMASSDTSLWNMGAHCPNLKIVTLFAAEIDDQILAKMKIGNIKHLQSLELSENSISRLPEDFNHSNSLLYLSLRRNRLTSLPLDLTNWTNLRFLHLGSNQLDGTERLRIQKALPTTKIIF